MKVSKIYESFGDIEIPNKILVSLGYTTETPQDMMLNYRMVKEVTGRDGYKTINVIKEKYKRGYDENLVSLSDLCNYYGLEPKGVLERLGKE